MITGFSLFWYLSENEKFQIKHFFNYFFSAIACSLQQFVRNFCHASEYLIQGTS
eukprot:TRINITY_DN4742_c0_g1_i1.p1 TRINITY_DN4742_c0_g1~~TRINITY_DN4742_c0_g1_i1.p1  ORF type:complete len:54 (+),score=2.57 TRINITY_DN4742_c0_g1_i1:51-212(+)